MSGRPPAHDPDRGAEKDPGKPEKHCGCLPSSINIGKEGVVPFALLSTPVLNALTDIDRESLHFGLTGTEDSVISCASEGEDVNGDGRLDLICKADTQLAGFICTSTVALITGQLADGTRFQSEDTIKVVGCH